MCKYVTLTEYNSDCNELITDPHPTLTDLGYPLLNCLSKKQHSNQTNSRYWLYINYQLDALIIIYS